MFYSRNKRHFRNRKTIVKGKKILHPNYIVGEYKNYFLSFGLTHSNSKGKKHKNYKLSKNPKIGDDSPSYMRKQLDNGNKNEFTSRLTNFRMSAKDDDYVDSLIEKRRSYFNKK